jgi:hypothetical protein
VDGADEFDPQLRLVKGGGGDLLREKIVASATCREIIITDSRKQVDILGTTFALPVEVIPFAWPKVAQEIQKLNGNPVLRVKTDGSCFVTDQGNYILDCKFDAIPHPESLAAMLTPIIGLVEHGLFIDMASEVLMGKDESVYHFTKPTPKSPIILEQVQAETLQAIFTKVDELVAEGKKPVVELDLDLTTYKPISRAVKALQVAGQTYGIAEFLEPESHFDQLPGYSLEAWNDFLSKNRLPEKYPELRWIGFKDGTGADASVYSAFHIAFWRTEWLAEDILTEGTAAFVAEVEARGGLAVFISGRWTEEQFAPSREVLTRGGIKDPILLIGNPHHDGSAPISDSEIKALRQPEIREKYGIPVAFVDDRVENRDAVVKANPGIDMLSVGISIPGFTYDEGTTGVALKISTFEFSK